MKVFSHSSSICWATSTCEARWREERSRLWSPLNVLKGLSRGVVRYSESAEEGQLTQWGFVGKATNLSFKGQVWSNWPDRYRERAFGTTESGKNLCTGIKASEQGTFEGTSSGLVYSAGRQTVERVRVQANKHRKRCLTWRVQLGKCTFRPQWGATSHLL